MDVNVFTWILMNMSWQNSIKGSINIVSKSTELQQIIKPMQVNKVSEQKTVKLFYIFI